MRKSDSMYSKDQLIGILLSLAKTEIHVSKDDSTRIGYRVRLKVSFRGGARMLQAVQRTLLQHNIESKYKEKEHKTRPRPILMVTGKKNLTRLCELLPRHLPDVRDSWDTFREAVDIFDRNLNHTMTGLQRMIELKNTEAEKISVA